MLQRDSFEVPAVAGWLEEFWLAAGRGALVLRSCRACARLHHYPRGICPWCSSTELDWHAVRGTGVIESFTVVRVGEPYALAYVRLDEGISVMTNLVDCAPEDLAVGQPVRVVFKPVAGRDDTAVPCFTPSAVGPSRVAASEESR
ncbi:MAG: Zn-ribbon domain-containing OB-fold protein [Propionibacteriaceae bacterium]|nr:Zn-ribbon domain-containing OB-fold protein [Propionibacteriaceae bacterium]